MRPCRDDPSPSWAARPCSWACPRARDAMPCHRTSRQARSRRHAHRGPGDGRHASWRPTKRPRPVPRTRAPRHRDDGPARRRVPMPARGRAVRATWRRGGRVSARRGTWWPKRWLDGAHSRQRAAGRFDPTQQRDASSICLRERKPRRRRRPYAGSTPLEEADTQEPVP